MLCAKSTFVELPLGKEIPRSILDVVFLSLATFARIRVGTRLQVCQIIYREEEWGSSEKNRLHEDARYRTKECIFSIIGVDQEKPNAASLYCNKLHEDASESGFLLR
jgi:hypothetical protein